MRHPRRAHARYDINALLGWLAVPQRVRVPLADEPKWSMRGGWTRADCLGRHALGRRAVSDSLPPPSERETGVACPLCSPEEEPGRPPPTLRDGVCPACLGAGWLTMSEWASAKRRGLLERP